MRWQVQEAKQRFSEVLRAAAAGEPQIITKHGEEVAALIDIARYRQLQGESVTLMDYLHGAPSVEEDLEFVRRPDRPRAVDLAD